MGVFDGSLGAFMVGTLLSTLLLGITATQAFNYYKLFPNDARLYFWIVTFMLVIDWFSTAVACYTVYDWMVTHYGDVAHLVNSPWSFALSPILTGIAASVVQVFYAYRVYVVTKRRLIVPVCICILSVVQLAFACASTGMIFKLQAFAKFQVFTYGVSLWLGAAALADILITVSLVRGLVRSRSGIMQTNSVIDKLIELVIQSNGLTAACAIIDAVLFGVLSTSYHVVVNLCLIKLYFNSLLVSLNARADLEKFLLGPRSFDAAAKGSFPSLMTASGFNATDLGPAFARPQAVKVHVNTLETIMSTTADKSDSEKLRDAARQQVHAVPAAYPPSSPHSTLVGSRDHGMQRKDSESSFSTAEAVV